jgi:hypothetical protein
MFSKVNFMLSVKITSKSPLTLEAFDPFTKAVMFVFVPEVNSVFRKSFNFAKIPLTSAFPTS